MVNMFTLDWALLLVGWIVAVSGLWPGGGRVGRARVRAAPFSTRPFPVRSMTLAMSPLDSSPPVSSIQSQIGAEEVRIEGVQAQIAEVAESVKAVQSQVVEVGAKIETTKIDLKQAKLLPDDREILMLDLKRLMDKKKSLMDKEKSLMDEKKSLMDEKKILMGELSTNKFSRVADFSAVWTAILNGNITKSPENSRLWSLPDGVEWIGDIKTIYNRPCYDDMIASTSSVKRMLIIGTPGIGKTVFLQVFLVFLAERARAAGQPPPAFSTFTPRAKT